MIGGLIKRIVILVICGGLGVGGGLGASYVLGAPMRGGQEAAKRVMGEKVGLCADATKLQKVRVSKITLTGKIAVMRVRDNTLYQPFQDVLKADRQAKEPSEVAGVLCLVDYESVFDTEYYGASKKYSCIRFSEDFDAYLVDAATGKTVAYRRLDGMEPDTCPDKTDSNLTRYGELPDPADVAAWIP